MATTYMRAATPDVVVVENFAGKHGISTRIELKQDYKNIRKIQTKTLRSIRS